MNNTVWVGLVAVLVIAFKAYALKSVLREVVRDVRLIWQTGRRVIGWLRKFVVNRREDWSGVRAVLWCAAQRRRTMEARTASTAMTPTDTTANAPDRDDLPL
jgi:hypothetical protein